MMMRGEKALSSVSSHSGATAPGEGWQSCAPHQADDLNSPKEQQLICRKTTVVTKIARRRDPDHIFEHELGLSRTYAGDAAKR